MHSEDKISIECEQCFKVYKQVDKDDITCEKDLRVGMCKECMKKNWDETYLIYTSNPTCGVYYVKSIDKD